MGIYNGVAAGTKWNTKGRWNYNGITMEFSSGLAEENATKLRRLKYWKLQRNLTRNYKDIITEIYSRVYLQRNCNRIRTTSHRNYNGIITTALQRNSNDITTGIAIASQCEYIRKTAEVHNDIITIGQRDPSALAH